LRQTIVSLVIVGIILAGVQAARTANAQTSDARQLAPAALSAADVSGFHVLSEQDVSVKSDGVIASAWQRVLGADDSTASGGAALSVLLMVPNTAVSTDILKGIVSTGSAFSSVSAATNLRLTGPLGIGDADQSATWQQWDAEDNTWDAFYADEFLTARTMAAVIYGSHSDAVDPTQIVTLAQRQARLLASLVPPTPSATATPTAPPVR
jgi:hypothetical protein